MTHDGTADKELLPPTPFALRLRCLGVRQATVARLAGVGRVYVNDCYHGRRTPSRRVIQAVDRLERELGRR